MASSGLPACCDRIGIFKARWACVERPQVGDTGTLVYAYDVTWFAVECVNREGMTVWLADFFAEELEFLGERNVETEAPERDRANRP